MHLFPKAQETFSKMEHSYISLLSRCQNVLPFYLRLKMPLEICDPVSPHNLSSFILVPFGDSEST